MKRMFCVRLFLCYTPCTLLKTVISICQCSYPAYNRARAIVSILLWFLVLSSSTISYIILSSMLFVRLCRDYLEPFLWVIRANPRQYSTHYRAIIVPFSFPHPCNCSFFAVRILRIWEFLSLTILTAYYFLPWHTWHSWHTLLSPFYSQHVSFGV